MSSQDLPPLQQSRQRLAELQAEWQNREIMRSVLSLQFGNGAIVRVGAVFERSVLQEVAGEVARRIETMPRGRAFLEHRRARFLVDAVGKIVQRGSERARRALLSEARDLARSEVRFLRQVGKDVIGAQFTTPAPALVEAAITDTPMMGREFGKWFTEWVPQQTEARVVARVRAGMVAGETTPQIVRALRGTSGQGFANGELARARHALSTITRTTLTHTANLARDLTFRDNVDVVPRVRWLSVLDLRTSTQCIALDGKSWRTDEPHPSPPIHPGCRSMLIPKIGRPLGTRASLGGRIRAGADYDDWLRTRSRADQDLVLGQRKAAAWRAGDLSVDDMVDATKRRVLTLDELEAAGKLSPR
jgi:SPP1 gp7 family putative phage head morphogenesis protein